MDKEALRKELADLIFKGKEVKDYTYYEEKYVTRQLKEGAKVTRFAPSPTGFIHMGGIYSSLIAKLLAKESEGVFYLRIEDTDQERSIENGIETILKGLKEYNLNPDEGPISEKEEHGNYGPYIQSKRSEIYNSYAKKLLLEGKAYPCFLTKEELEEIRDNQKRSKLRPGIYGLWSKYREMPLEMAIEEVKKGTPYVIRLKSESDFSKKIIIKDLIKGKLELPQDDTDVVIIKGDGLPTYHFAHAIDDHLMGTTVVTRGDEWLPSVALHIGLFIALGFKVPKFGHISPLLKLDEGNKRKLSKRKDPEASASYLIEIGVPVEAVEDYLLNIANANFEMWRKQNPRKDIMEFKFELSKMNASGALFDMVKLLDVSKNHIAYLTKEEILDNVLVWAEKYDNELYELLSRDKEYALKVFGVERPDNFEEKRKLRKDLAKWEDVKEQNIYMFNDKFKELPNTYEFITDRGSEETDNILKLAIDYVENYLDLNDDKNMWFDKIKDISEKYGYAREVKEYKANPEAFKGHVGDVSSFLRVIITKRNQTPDLYEIINILGKEEVEERINQFKNFLNTNSENK